MLRNEQSEFNEEILINGAPSINKQFTYDMIVFSHLRWDFVYQRPQHLISRISQTYKTLFIEEPVFPDSFDKSGFDLEIISPKLSVLKPRVNSIFEIRKILQRLNIEEIKLAWFYSPAFMEILHCLSAEKIIYDCMDELSLFKGAPTILKEQEQELLKTADLILTGGVSLYEEKSKFSDVVHCFPSSVDYQHFNKAKQNLSIPEDIKSIKKPVIGYIGVIDERIDMNLLKQSAALMPDKSFVMIGPLAKIEEKDLAKADNIHYLGMKSYGELPNYLKAFDVAMMPFSMNDATRFISPTKTLEYMAAGKPIISTPIKDVVRSYQDCVHIIQSPEDFKQAVEQALVADDFSDQYQKILKQTSWDHTAKEMLKLIKTLAA